MLKGAQFWKSACEFDPFLAIGGADGGAILWARQGTACAEHGDPVGALRCFRRSIETDLDCVEAWTGLSEVFTRMHDRRRAGACLDVVRSLLARCEDVTSPVP